jgi:predicted nucleotidyltransferase
VASFRPHGAILCVVTRSISPALAAVLDEFRRQLIEHLGERLVGLTLFGSHARGEAGPDSDVDVAVVLDRIDSHSERIWPMQLSAAFEGLLLVPIVLSRSELDLLRAREDILAESLDRDGIALMTEAA